MNSKSSLSLQHFIEQNKKLHGDDPSSMLGILSAIENATENINKAINRAGLNDILGAVGSENIQGEQVQKLDLYANDQIIKSLKNCGLIAAVASEENEDIIPINASGDYLFATDPLDGSSNIDVNISVGTIFSVFKRVKKGEPTSDEFYRYGNEQVLAGYILYGTSTQLVYTCKSGVHIFTYDPERKCFILVNKYVETPHNGAIYSINEGNYNSLDLSVLKYIDYCKKLNDNGNRTHTARFMGSLVADFHRNMIKGGIFIYPATADAPLGRLRLLYECNPIALLAEQSGGRATCGSKRLLDIKVSELHQRTPFFTGSKNMMDKALSFISEA